MKRTLFFAFFTFSFGVSWAANFGLPIINKASRYYYVPQLKKEKAGGKSFLSSSSYSGSGFEHLKIISFFSGFSRCDWQNVILVDKKTGLQKPLFKEIHKITAFFITTENDPKLKLPQLMLIATKEEGENAPTEFYVANSDGTDLKRVSPVGKNVISYDVDSQEKKLILLLNADSPDDSITKEAQPYVVDLKKISEAIPMIEQK